MSQQPRPQNSNSPCLPIVDNCCGCVTDLKTAAAIIAVLGVVTSPAVSWAMVRHSFVIRVSCMVTTSTTRADVVDISLNNMLTFGFGANAGLGPSCLVPKNATNASAARTSFRGENVNSETECSPLVKAIQWIGWIALTADIIFVCFSLHLLYKIFRPPFHEAALRFMISCIITLTITLFYGMAFVAACVTVGRGFPIFEFFFCLMDTAIWIYFLIVIKSYYETG